MPVYEYLCGAGHVFERILPVREYLAPQACSCGAVGQKVILHPPRVFADFEGYESPATGRWIAGRTARRQDLAESGCQPYEVGMRQDAERFRRENDMKLDRVTDELVEQTMHELTA